MPQVCNSSSNIIYYSGMNEYILRVAFISNFEGLADYEWCLNSSATHHLTNNIVNLQIREEFKSIDQLIMGNGQSLSITHVGYAFLSFRASNLSSIHISLHIKIAFKDVLLIPSITKNLLSIFKLTSDNLISVELSINVYFVQDMKGQILLDDIAKKGLYKLLLNSTSFSSSCISYLYHSQLNKPIFTLSILKNCDAFTKACYYSISNKCTTKPNVITLLHRRFGYPNWITLLHLLKSCKQFKASQKDILSSLNSLCEACQLVEVH